MSVTMIPCNQGSSRRYKYRSTSSDEPKTTVKLLFKSDNSSDTSSTISTQYRIPPNKQGPTSRSPEDPATETEPPEASQPPPGNMIVPQLDLRAVAPESDDCLEMYSWNGLGCDGIDEAELSTHA